jgi:putative Na+/H+ antiporter
MRILGLLFLTLCLWGVRLDSAGAASAPDAGHGELDFPKSVESYHDDETPNLLQKLISRVKAEPFNLVGTIIFWCAIIHTFLTSKFMHIAHAYKQEFEALEDREMGADRSIERRRDALQFRAQFFHFMGEVEAVFGIWLVPLFISIVLMKGWPKLVSYITSLNPAEPVFVVVIMAIASSRPILRLTESWLAKLAGLGGSTPGAWWLSILTLGPLVGGTLTHFAAPPVVMVATKWTWDMHYMLWSFGWKAALGIIVATPFTISDSAPNSHN